MIVMTTNSRDYRSLQSALRTLHRALLNAQRVEAERFDGRMNSGELLQAAVDDLRFSWIGRLTTLIAALDAALAEDDREGIKSAITELRALLGPPDPESAFGARYLRALQDHPDVVFAHRDVMAALTDGDR
jgi:hypothetical protein